MKHISQTIPGQNVPMTQQPAPSPAYTKQQNIYRTNQIASLVRQAFDIFNTYGKDPDALENLIKGFALALEGIRTEFITEAFADWMKISSVMPTPADIRKIAMETQMAKAKYNPDGARLINAQANPKLPPPTKSYEGKSHEEWDAETKIQFLTDFQNCEQSFLEPLLRLKQWDWEGFQDALEDLRKKQEEALANSQNHRL